jgi:RimJ/RimL family protein N-acetyltransferase
METLLLRNWQLSDKTSLAIHADSINIWNNLRDYFPNPYTEKDAEAFIKSVINKGNPSVDFAIEINGEAVGGIGIVPQCDVERISAEIGYWLGEAYWNKGIMTSVVQEMVTYTFENFAITKIYAPVFDFNLASQKVLIKAGFEREAILKKAAIKNGRIIDLHYYSLIKTKG